MKFASLVCLVCGLCLCNTSFLLVVLIGWYGENGVFDDIGSKTFVMLEEWPQWSCVK